MRRLLAIAMFVLVAAAPGWATPTMWGGAFTYDIVQLSTVDVGNSTLGLKVGDTFGGYYRYLSPIVDGTFGVSEFPLTEFGICVPDPIAFYGGEASHLYQWFDSAIPISGPLIRVLGGSVTDFYLHPEIGPVGFDFTLKTFHLTWNVYFSGYSILANGVVHFGDPRAVPEPTTMLLLGVGLIGLAGYGRKRLFKLPD